MGEGGRIHLAIWYIFIVVSGSKGEGSIEITESQEHDTLLVYIHSCISCTSVLTKLYILHIASDCGLSESIDVVDII